MNSTRELYPLTIPQQSFYYDYLLYRNDSKYNMGGILLLNGKLDIELFREAYNFTIQKFDTLRMRLVAQDGELYQFFLPEHECEIEYLDFRDKNNPLNDATRFILAENARPFPFEEKNLFMEMVLQTGDEQYIWFTRFHHFSNDAYGRSVINKVTSDTYNSLLVNGCFPEIQSFSYLDFLEDDLKYRQSDEFKNSSEYWRKKLTPLPEPLDFTVKKYGIKNFSLHNERVTLNLHRMCYASMLKIGEEEGVSPFQTLIGIFYITLYKLYNKKDIVIGMPVLNRSNFKFKNTPGLFMNMTPLRLRMEDEWTFCDLLNFIKAELRECYRHQRLPLSEIIKHFRNIPEFKNELFDITVVYRKMDFSQKFGDAKLHTVTLDTEIRNESFGMEIDEYDDDENVNIFFNYNPLVLSAQEVLRFAKCFETVLFELIYFPEKSLAQVKFMSEFEKDEVINAFNNNPEAKHTNQTIIEKFNDCAIDHSNKVSITDNNESITYRDLNCRSNQIANYLIEKQNVSKGDIVCLSAERSADCVAAMIGIMKAGAVCLPVDRNNPQERIEYIYKNSGAGILITDNPEYKKISDKVLLLNETELAGSDCPSVEIHNKDLAYIIYTSGSTGTPKGVMIEHGSFMSMFVNMIGNFGISESDRVLQFASLGFDAAVFEIFQALLPGATLVIASKEIIQDPDSFIQYMDDKKVTVATIPPAYLSALDKPVFPHLHTLITAGEQAIVSDVNYYKNFKRVINAYGPTEASVCASWFVAESDVEYKDYVPVGKAVPGSSIYILNDNLELLPAGFAGELCISGPGLARGYLNNEELTGQRFIVNPFDANSRLYRTGDKARWLPDGNIEFIGRTDDQVKIRGNRIELGEIESRLKNCSTVKDAVVLDIETNNARDIAAYVIGGEAAGCASLRKFLLEFLPEYMVPQHFYFIEKFPLTQNGKINKDQLRKMVSEKPAATVDSSALPSLLELQLLPIFENVLNYSPLGVNDNFFESGGDSLKIARLITRIKKELQLEINFRTIFDNPTVRGVASELEFSSKDEYEEIKTVPENEYYPLSHSQKRLWILAQDSENDSVYNMPVPLLLKGNLNPENLRRAVNAVVERHESLRTIFIDINGTPFQKIPENYDSVVKEYDFSGEKNAEEKASVVVNKAVNTPFDLSAEIPIRVLLVKIDNEKYVFLLVLHHIAGDGISIGIIMNELSKLYNSFCSGDEKPFLEPLAIQYKDYAAWQNKMVEGDSLTGIKEYWHRKLIKPRPGLNLPADFKRKEQMSKEGELLYYKLDVTLVEELNAICKSSNASLYMVLLAIANILLYKYTREEDIIVGSTVAGRQHFQLENQVGFFMNTLVLRNKVNPENSFQELLKDVNKTLSEAIDNQAYPFDALVNDLNAERIPNRNPLFDVMVEWMADEGMGIRLKLNGIEALDYNIKITKSLFDLSFLFEETGGKISYIIEYNTSLFKRETIDRMSDSFKKLAESIISNPNQKIKNLEVIPAEEKEKLLSGYDKTTLLPEEEKGVIDLFNYQTEVNKNGIALVCDGRSVTYVELDKLSNRIANRIIENFAPKREDIIAVIINDSVLAVASLLAVMKTGAAYLPVMPDNPQERIAFMIKDSNAKAVLTDANILFSENDSSPGTKTEPDSLAYIIYTSGSTGTPKGVMIEHNSLANLIFSLKVNFYSNYKESLNELMIGSFAFDVSLKQIFAALCNGNTLHILSREKRSDPREIAKYIVCNRINVTDLTPSLFSVMLEEGFGEADKPCLRELFLGSEALPYKLVKSFYSNEHNRRINVTNFYGPTECCVESSFFRFNPEMMNEVYDIAPIGKPVLNEQIYILDKYLNLCPVGVYGEICIGGRGLARQYLNDPEKTAEKFVSFPLLNGTRIYKTGDMGRVLPDGNIEFSGRMDDQVKIRGYRIELQEIENRLREMSGIKECAVTLIEREGIGELAAYFTSDSQIGHPAIKNHLDHFLPKYMVPSYFIQIEKMPVSANGKTDKKSLPYPSKTPEREEFRGPQDETESLILSICSEVLKREGIGLGDNFFEIGGNSLNAVRLISRIQKEINVNMELKDIFYNPVLLDMAEKLKRSFSPDK